MIKSRALWLVVGFLGILGFQSFHHHSAHEGGLFTPHEDCSLCLRVGGSAGGDVVPRSPEGAPQLVVEQGSPRFFSFVFVRPNLQPFGRAPPTPSVQ